MENKKVYKFIGFSNKTIRGLDRKKVDSLKKKTIFASKYTKLNDPYEAKRYFDDIQTLFGENIHEKLLSNHLVASFTSNDYDYSPMWAYYANNHSGICIEFDVLEDSHLKCIKYVSEQESIEDDILDLKRSIERNGYQNTVVSPALV